MQIYPPGTRIGQYEIASRPMMGGMGVVYFALDHGNDGRPIALKTFRPELLPDRAARDRFLREGTAWIELGSHPHIVRCYKVEYIDPTAFLVLELIAKEQNMPDASLRSWLIPGNPLPIEQALLFALQIARGMQHATETIPGFVHRDLKPENILVGADKLPGTNIDRLRVTDFGLVKTIADSGAPANTSNADELKPNQIQFTRGVGTPLYMAPEQWKGEPIGVFTDVYAFGCILFEMLSGHHAAEGKTILELQISHCDGRTRFLPSKLPNDLKTLVNKCLALKPIHRYRVWDEITNALESIFFSSYGKSQLGKTKSAVLNSEDRVQAGWSFVAIGRAYHDIGKLSIAKDYFQKVINLSNDIGDRRLEGVALSNLGVAYLDLGDTQRAIGYFEKCLTLAREFKARRQEGIILGDLGVAYRNLGKVQQAIEYHNLELEIAREIDDQRGVQKALENLGSAFRNIGETAKALDYYEQALYIANEDGNRLQSGAILNGIGTLYLALGDVHRAVDYLENALTCARNIGDRYGEATALGDLGLAYETLGNISRSIECSEEALAIIDEIGDKRLKGNCLTNLANVYLNQGNLKLAMDYYEQSLAISREVGDRNGEATALTNLGGGFLKLGKTTHGIELFEQALIIMHEIEDKRGISANLDFLGNAYSDLGDSQRAIEYHKQGLALARQIGDREREASALSNLGIDYSSLKEVRQAVSYFEQALKISREIGNRLEEGQILSNLGIAYELQDPQNALHSYGQALAIHREFGDFNAAAKDSFNMALLYHQSGNNTNAISLAQQAARIWTHNNNPNAKMARQWIVNIQLRINSDDERKQLLSNAQEAFLSADSFDEMLDKVGEYPIIADKRFIQILENALLEDMGTPDHRSDFKYRLGWLKQIADE